MKYPCGLIRDLLPLFHDGVCSEETREAVHAHLSECESCRDEYEMLCESEEILPAAPDPADEKLRAQAIAGIKMKMGKRRLRIWALVIALALIAGGILYAWNEHGEMVMPYQERMHAYFEENGDLVLVGELPCSVMQISQILVPAESEGQVENHVFMRYSCKPLDYLLCSLLGNRTDSMHVVAFAEKGAQDIDAIHFTTADFPSGWFSGNDHSDPLPENQLLMRINASVTVWEKE